MTGNLIPEYRTDKNGRSVLRHVRPEKFPAINSGLVSAVPALASPVALVGFNEGLQSFWDRHEISNSGYTCDDFAPKAVEALNRFFSPDSEHEPYSIMRALHQSFSEMLGFDEEEDGRISTHNVAAFGDDIHEASDLRRMIEGLHRTVGYRKDYLLESDDDERAKAVALMRFTDHVGENLEDWDLYTEMEREKYVHYVAITDESITELVMDYYQRIDDLITIIGETNKMPPADHLRAIMDHEQPSLARGVL